MTEEHKETNCVICNFIAEITSTSDHGSEIRWKCVRCGEFTTLDSAKSLINNLSPPNQAKLSGWIFDQNGKKMTPVIDRDIVERVTAQSRPSIRDRIDRFLLEAINNQSKLGSIFDAMNPRFIAATYSQDIDEVMYLIQVLTHKQMIDQPYLDGGYQVLYEGYNAIDSLIREKKSFGTCFIAMSFDESLNEAYNKGFKIGIQNAGYDPVRVDKIEHIKRIDDEILVQIRNSNFIVADFTEHKHGVYFEAGFALGLNLPVIWTCRKDSMGGLHFDIRQYNTIKWDSPEDLADRLKSRITEVVGMGPRI